MYKTGILLAMVMIWPSMLPASEEQPPQVPSVRERVRNALGSEGGASLYKDFEGNVETMLDPPGGERRVTVQPPQSPSMNLGLPLQRHNAPFYVPHVVVPAGPPVPDFPRKAR